MRSTQIQRSRLALPALGVLLLASSAAAQTFRLTREESVRFDTPGLEPDLARMVDEPAPIDKQRFRKPSLADARPRSVFVRFQPGIPEPTRQLALTSVAGARVVWESRLVPDLYAVEVPAGQEGPAIESYLDLASTLYAEPERIHRAGSTPDDPYYLSNDLWGLTGPGCTCSPGDAGSRANWAWEEWTGSSNVIVAIVDTGIDWAHADLGPNIWSNADEVAGNGIDDDGNGYVDDTMGWDFADGDADPMPHCSDHGTHVAGTVGARGNNGVGVVGVNWSCRLMNLRCEATAGSCNGIGWMTQATEYAILNGARVSNHSYGGPGLTQSLYDVLLAAQSVGHIAVCGAGNAYTDNDVAPFYPASFDLANVISVTATDAASDQHYNYGQTSVDLGAPGLAILSTVRGQAYDWFYGTSMASPHVAGALALTWSRHPELSWTQMRDRLLTAVALDPDFTSTTASGGVLDAHRMLGVWMDPANGNPHSSGTRTAPFGPGELQAAYDWTPRSGHLNLLPGSVPTNQLPSLFDRPVFLDAPNGPVRLGD
jgi:hypothetical protein